MKNRHHSKFHLQGTIIFSWDFNANGPPINEYSRILIQITGASDLLGWPSSSTLMRWQSDRLV
jgi:hypothetical protein